MEDDILIEIIIKKLNAIHDLLLERKKPFLDINEASKYLGISKNTLYGYTSKNVIPYHKIQGRKLYFSIDDLNKFVLDKKTRYKSMDEIEMEAATRIVTGRVKKY